MSMRAGTRSVRLIYALMTANSAFVAIALALIALSWDAPLPDTWGFRGYGLLHAIAFTTVGALIALRQRTNIIGWLLLYAGVLSATGAFGIAVGEFTIAGDHPGKPLGVFGAWLGSWLWAPVVSLILPLVLLRFPDGRLFAPWLWLVESSAFVTTGGLAGYMALRPGPLQLAPYLDNPVAIDAPALLNVFFGLGTTGFLAIGAAAWSVVVRFRRSAGIERQQLKWLAFSVLPLAVAGVASAVLPDKAGQVLYVLLQLFVPIAIAIAILRHRLYDIDMLIRRTLIYLALSAVLIVAYVGAVGSLQALLAPFTSGNGVAVAISTLAVVALFQPVRSRIQHAVDRRFYRSKYNAERTLDAFAVRLREQIDLEALQGELLAVVDETMQPVRSQVWLRRQLTGPDRFGRPGGAGNAADQPASS